MNGLSAHLPILPVVVPLIAGALVLLFDDRQRRIKAVIGTVATLTLVAVSLALLNAVAGADGESAVQVYRVGNWQAPFGIVLVADRLSALMVLVTSILGACAFLYSLASWAIVGPRFHSIFLLLLMGLNGAFLTGDLFNLYVFFEVLLAASYGLLLHGSGRARIKAGMHYIAVNLASSMLFLIGVGLIYGMTGTLNMADLSLRVHTLPADDLALFQAGLAILGVAFLTKAGMWPLSFWLPNAYASAAPPAAAVFALMTKVGVYVVLRTVMLLSGGENAMLLDFITPWLLYGGIATILFGSIGVLANKELSRIAAYSTLVSSGILLAAIGTTDQHIIGAALYYMVGSTLVIGAAFLLAELINRKRDLEPVQAVEPVFRDDYETDLRHEFEGQEVGVAFPATTALLGGLFVLCAMMLAGLPPLSGFLAKFAIMAGIMSTEGPVLISDWVLVTLIVLSGLATLLALMRKGVEVFWQADDEKAAKMRAIELVPIVVLMGLCVALTVFAAPAMTYFEATGATLIVPSDYGVPVLGGPP